MNSTPIVGCVFSPNLLYTNRSRILDFPLDTSPVMTTNTFRYEKRKNTFEKIIVVLIISC